MLMIFMYLIKTEMFSGKRELCLFSTEVCSKKHGRHYTGARTLRLLFPFPAACVRPLFSVAATRSSLTCGDLAAPPTCRGGDGKTVSPCEDLFLDGPSLSEIAC